MSKSKNIKVSVANAYKYLEGLNRLESINTSTPVEIGFPIIENIHRIKNALSSSMELRDKIILKYSNGSNQINKDENPDEYEKCSKELEKLGGMELEISILCIEPSKMRSTELPMWAFFALSFMCSGEK